MVFDPLRASLNLHWLRPDNALWIHSFHQTFGNFCKDAVSSGKSSIDIGCGDGTTSFIMLDGEFNKSFDLYHDVQINDENLNSVPERSTTGSLDDEKGDFYNTYSSNWKDKLKIEIEPVGIYDLGTDWKKPLVDKAIDLNLYKETVVHDCNVVPLPFKEDHYNYVFSTIIYWLADTKKTLKAINTIMKKDGIFAFSSPKENITDFTLSTLISDYNYPHLERLDRGRHSNWNRHKKTKLELENDFRECGFKLIDYKEFNSSLQIAMGETIIRTLLKSYLVLYKRLLPKNKDILQEFKDCHVDEFYKLLTPFKDLAWISKKEHKKLYHAFFLQKI